MYSPQAGIFALGTCSHVYLQFDMLDPKKREVEKVECLRLHGDDVTLGNVELPRQADVAFLL